MNLTEYLVKDLTRVGFRARSKSHALRQIAELAATAPEIQSKGIAAETILKLLEEREAVVSTGVGNGVAIPHARLDAVEAFTVFVLTAPDGVEFEALDGRRVHLFVVILAPTSQVTEHLKLLAGLSNTLNRTALRKELLKTKTSEVLYEILMRYLSGTAPEVHAETRKRRLMIFVLYREELLNDLLEYLLDMNVEGATIMHTEGMGAHISTLPLFASFMGFMREDRKASHTIMTLIPEQDEAEIIRGIEAITGDLDTTTGAMVMTLDTVFYKGTMNML